MRSVLSYLHVQKLTFLERLIKTMILLKDTDFKNTPFRSSRSHAQDLNRLLIFLFFLSFLFFLQPKIFVCSVREAKIIIMLVAHTKNVKKLNAITPKRVQPFLLLLYSHIDTCITTLFTFKHVANRS